VRRVVVALAVLIAVAALPAAQSLAAPAGPPTGVTGIALDASVQLAWQSVSGATAYSVYRGTSPTSLTTQLTPTGGISSTSFTDSTAVNGTTYYYAVRAAGDGAESGNSLTVQARADARACTSGNAVVLENCFPGSATWRATNVVGVGSGGIEGFATASSINKGETVNLKINSDAGSTYRIEIYRSGYYGGDGARLFSTIRGITGTPQPTCVSNATTGLLDCSNWSVSATITTTSSWPSGVYLLKLVRQDTNRESHILLTVRDDARASDLLYGVAVTDFQAYNNYGGKSLYDFNSSGPSTVAGTSRAVKVSFDRPYSQVLSGQRDWYTKIDFATVYWLEQSGYDVAYQANTDMERNGARVLGHRAYVSPAHDEYYSAGMRTALEQARGAGVHLFFTGSNEIYWKIRLEASPVTGAQDRVQVCYKSTQSGGPDPSGIPTGTWRDPAGANNPENALTGVLYVGDNDTTYFPLVVSATEGTDRVFRYTGLDAQAPGTATSIGSDLVGWEWDARMSIYSSFEPAGVKTLASSPVTGSLIQNHGRNSTPGQTTTHMVKYTAASGALVVTTGTNHWNRGLANNVDGVGEAETRIQQITTNVLADMNALPQTPAGDIVLDNPGTRPPAPTGLTAQALGSDSVRLTWNAVPNTQGYNIYRTLAPRQNGEPLGARANAGLVTGTTFTDTGLSSNTTYYFIVTSVAAGTQSLASNEASATTAASAGQPTRVNSGGPSYTSSTGQIFSADNFFAGGTVYQVSSGTTISGTNDPALYRNERWGNFNYAIPVAAGKYDVRFHFVELYYGTAVPGGPGKRVFSMDITDTATNPDLANIDIYAQVGPRAAHVRTVSGVTVTDGVLNIRSVYGPADDPEIAAIEILPLATAPTVTQTVPQDGEASVSRLVKPKATFSRAMDPATVTSSSFTLRRASDGTLVPATVGYDAATASATLTPSSALAFNAAYTARLEATVKAADGTALAAPVTWTFTTQDAVPPQVTSTFPADGATGISASVKPRATFSRSLDPATVNSSSFTLRAPGGALVPATVAYDDATRSAVFTPNAPLAFSTTYTARIETTVTSSDGVPLSSPVAWSFTTAPEPPPAPTVTARTPAANATNVGVTTPVTATFSRDMDASTISTASFLLTGPSGAVPASVTYDAATRQARLTPSAPLAYSTQYAARLTTAVHASDGTPLAADDEWLFSTAPPPPAPTVVGKTPADGSAYAARSTTVTATFSEPMDPATITSSSFRLLRPDGTAVDGSLTYAGGSNTATLTPSQLLAGGTDYTARLESTIKSASGIALAAPVSWTFTTAACPCSLFSPIDTPANPSLPTQDGRTGTGPWSYELGVKIRVDQPTQVSALRFYKSPGETGSHTGRIWSEGGVQLALVSFATETSSGWQQQALASPLTIQPGATYVVSVNANAFFPFTQSGLQTQIISGPLRSVADGQNGVFGSAAGVFPAQSYSSSNYFVDLEVVPDGDPVPPAVLSVTPASGASGVDRNTTVTATFSRPMEPTTLTTSSFSLRPSGGSAVPATVTYDDGTNSAILTPNASLSYSTTYTAQLTTGVRARDGKPLASAVSWSFTTADPTRPQVTLTVPADGANDVGPTVQPRAEFSKSLDPATVNTSTFTLTGPSGPVAGTVAYNDATKAATFTPNAALTGGGTYTARLDPSIRSTDGATLGSQFTWSFTVVAAPSPLDVTSTNPAPGATGVSRDTSVQATFNRSIDPATLTTSSFLLRQPDSTIVPASVSYNDASRTATLTPSSALVASTTYTAEVTTGVKAPDGTSLSSQKTWTFTTGTCPCQLFSPTLTPAKTGNSTRDGRGGSGPFSLELGIKITVDQAVSLRAIRYYRDPKETGAHTGTLWSATGAKLATVTFSSETASGWQQANFASSPTLQPGVTYVISVNANANYVVTQGGLATQVVSGPLRSVADGQNGVFASAAGIFPAQSFNSSNYFVDAVVR
jgi:fibronectin type 3 domain-containing protein